MSLPDEKAQTAGRLNIATLTVKHARNGPILEQNCLKIRIRAPSLQPRPVAPQFA